MIKSKDVTKETAILDKVATVTVEEKSLVKIVVLKGILKAVVLAVKLLRDIRYNQMLDLKTRGVLPPLDDEGDTKE